MKKVKGVVDRFEDKVAVIRAEGQDVFVPADFLTEFSEGQELVILFSSLEEDGKSTSDIAKDLLGEILKED